MGWEQLESRHLLADLAITSVVFANRANPNLDTIPVVGEQVCLKINFQTNNLPAGATYRIQFTFDGLSFGPSAANAGAGMSGTWNYYYYQCAWFASPATHTYNVILDADNTNVETSETNNTLASDLTFTPGPPTTLPQKFMMPVGGVPYRDWSIVNYADVDPRPTLNSDFRGDVYSYDGHDAFDISAANFSKQDAGIPIFAAADGVVESVGDGNFDRNTSWGGQPANFVVINHGAGWKTQYYHLAVNTVAVQVGETVTAGRLLGLMGSSGISTGTHLHFTVQRNNATVETNYDTASYFVVPNTPQTFQPVKVMDMGIANFTPSGDEFKERPPEQTTFSTSTPQNPLVWFFFSHLHPGDQFSVSWYRPDGARHVMNTSNVSGTTDQRLPYYWWSIGSGNLTSFPGVWRVAVEYAGAELSSRTFTVVSGPGAAGIKVSEGPTVIKDNRLTAIDFGSAAVGASVLTKTFTVQNHGNAPLNLTGLELPPGFSLNSAFPASIAAGGSTTFSVRLDTTRAGAKFGAIKFATNDPEVPEFSFNISGIITGAAPVGAPVITLPAPATAYTLYGQATVIDAAATLTDSDSAHFNGGNLTVEFVQKGALKDQLLIRNVGTGAGQIGVSGANVTYGGVTIGTFTGGLNQTPLVVTFSSASATVAAVQALLRNIAFSTTATDFEMAARYVRYTLVDPSAQVSNQPFAVVITNQMSTTVLPENGNLYILDTSRGGLDNRWKLDLAGAAVRLTDLLGYPIDVAAVAGSTGHGTSVVTIPLSTFSGAVRLLVEGRSGADELLVDFAFGSPVPGTGLAFDGGIGADALNLTGGSTTQIAFAALGAAAGQIAVSGALTGSLDYANIEAVSDQVTVAERVFTFGGGADVITVVDAAGSNMTVDSQFSAPVTFANPSASLSVNAGGGDDSVAVNSVDAAFHAALSLNGDIGTDSLSLNSDLSLTGAAGLTLSAETVAVAANVDLAGAAGSVVVTADNLALNSTTTVVGFAAVTLRPQTASRPIDLGTETAGRLSLTDAELDVITTSTLRIGDATAGDIVVSADITYPAAANLELISGADILLSGGQLQASLGTILLDSGAAPAAVRPTRFGLDVTASGLTLGGDLAVVLNGTTVDSQYTQLNVAGQVTLTNTQLVLSGSFAPVGLQPFTLINNDGADAVSGTFAGLPEGALLTNVLGSGHNASISYVGGDGNDVVLSIHPVTQWVNSYAATSSGFRFSLSQPAMVAGLNLYDYRDSGGAFVLGAADVQLRDAGGALVPGSLIVRPGDTDFTFVATNGALGPGNYTVTLRSGADGFRTAASGLLDGNADGTAGDHFTSSFVVASLATRVSIPHFARGPEQAVNVPADSALGIPINIGEGAAVGSLVFDLDFDPGLLNVSGVTLPADAAPGGLATLTPLGSGRVRVTLTFGSPLAAGAQTVAYLQADVPASAAARYGEREVLNLSAIDLRDDAGVAIPAVDVDAVHVNTYFGDLGRNGRYDSFDVQQASRLAVRLDTGFQQHPLLDPTILGDFNGNSRLDSFDVQRLSRLALRLSVTEAPALPSPLPITTDTDRFAPAEDPPPETKPPAAVEISPPLALRADVDGTGVVDAQDVLWSIYYFNRSLGGDLPSEAQLQMLDVNRDNQFDPADVLATITDLNTRPKSAAGEATESADELDALSLMLAEDWAAVRKRK